MAQPCWVNAIHVLRGIRCRSACALVTLAARTRKMKEPKATAVAAAGSGVLVAAKLLPPSASGPRPLCAGAWLTLKIRCVATLL